MCRLLRSHEFEKVKFLSDCCTICRTRNKAVICVRPQSNGTTTPTAKVIRLYHTSIDLSGMQLYSQ